MATSSFFKSSGANANLQATFSQSVDQAVAAQAAAETARDQAQTSAGQALASQTAAAASATTASGHATTTAADAVSTAADAVQTAADRVQTGLDRTATGADRTQVSTDAAQVASDRTASANSAAAALTSQNAASASQTAAASSASSASTDAASTAADVVSTNADAVSTAADAVATAADRVQTGNDATASAGSATAAANSATAASTSATAASASQTAAASSAAAAAASYDSFDDRYLGPKAQPLPTVDNDGNSLLTGALLFDTTAELMKIWTGTAWINAGSAVNGTAEREKFTVGTSSGSYTGSTTVFPVTYDVGFVDFYLNGVKLVDGTDFTATNGTSITLTAAAASGDSVDIVAYGTFTLNSTALSDLTDVNTSGVTNGQILQYNSTNSRFQPVTFQGGAGYFVGENGTTGNTSSGLGDIFRVHEAALDTATTIPANTNALAAGPLTLNASLTVNGTVTVV